MALPNITFVLGEGGLNRPVPGELNNSGFQFYRATLPAGFGANDRIKKYNELAAAEADGITEGDADFGIIWYHLWVLFSINPGATAYVQINEVPALTGDYDFTELGVMQTFANGKIRQAGVYVDAVTFDTNHIAALQTVHDTLLGQKKPIPKLILTPDISGTADLTTLDDLRDTQDSKNVGLDITQDGNNKGKALYDDINKSVGSMGLLLGLFSYAEVHESIAWPRKFPAAFTTANGTAEFDVPAFSNGDLYTDTSDATVTGIHDKGFIFLRTIPGLDGSYYNSANAAVAADSDYAYLENSATIEEAIRQVYAAVIPDLNAPLNVNPDDGTLDTDTIMQFESLAENALAEMQKTGNFSGNDENPGYAATINPDQNILQSEELVMSVELVPRPIGRKIKINIGFTGQIN